MATNSPVYDLLAPLPAETGSIRLLSVAPVAQPDGRNANITELRGSLRTVKLSDSPRFVAISYVWGFLDDPSSLRSIFLDGHEIKITTNCYDAIQAVARKAKNLPIWVDAVCINQEDDKERSGQVLLMGEIYSWAESVYIWLGPGSKGFRDAANCIGLVPSQIQSLQYLDWACHPGVSHIGKYLLGQIIQPLKTPYMCLYDVWKTERKNRARKLKEAILYPWGPRLANFLDAYSAEDFENIFHHDWIRRAWTFQEVALASNPVILSGSIAIPWIELVRGIEVLLLINNHYSDNHRNCLYCQWFRKYRPNGVEPFCLPKGLDAWQSAFTVWLYMPRETSWNNRKIRAQLPSKYCSSHPKQSNPRSSPVEQATKVAEEPAPSRELESRPSFYAYQISKRTQMWSMRFATNLVWFLCFGFFVFLVLIQTDGYTSYQLLLIIMTSSSSVAQLLLKNKRLYYIWFGQDECIRRRQDTTGLLYPIHRIRRRVEWWVLPPRYELTNANLRDRVLFFSAALSHAIRSRNAKNAKDKCYAVFGVLSKWTKKLTDPSYAKDVGQVYRELFVDLLAWERFGPLCILDAGLPGLSNSPSWVPDWSRADDRTWIHSSIFGSDNTISASKGSKHEWKVQENHRLVVEGQRLGKVMLSSASFGPFAGPDLPDQLGSVDLFLQIYHAISRHCRLFVPLRTSFFSILHGVLPGQKDAEYQAQKDFDVWFRLLTTAVMTSEDISTQAVEFHTQITSNPQILRYHVGRCADIGDKRALFVTADGFIGTGSSYIAQGDQLALVTGTPLPLILRKAQGEDNEYQIVSSCLVAGLMEGELWDEYALEELVFV